MRLTSRLALFAAAGLLAGCAATPPVVAPAPVETPAPPPIARPSPAPMVEYPPIEPVEPPRQAFVPAPTPTRPPDNATVTTPAAEPLVEPPQVEPPPILTPTEPTDEHQLAVLLADLQRYGALNQDDCRRELNSVGQLLGRQRTDYNRIRLAVLYTLAKTTPQDDQRALQLLETVAKSNPGSPAAKQVAAVVQVQIAERVRAVRDEQQRAEAAVKKLEALRLMERDLLRDRIRGGGGGAGGGSSGGGGGGGG